MTWARFRLSTLGNLSPDGLAVDGEVEDYQVLVAEIGIPVPIDDQYTLDEDAALDLTGLSSIGDNDTKNGIASEAYTLVDDVTHGTLVLDSSTGEFVYTPEEDFYGTDTFTYLLSGTQSFVGAPSFAGGPGTLPVTGTRLATVTLTVTPVNDVPFAVDQNFVTTEPSDTNPATTAATITKAEMLTGALPQDDAAIRSTPWDEVEQSLKVVQISVVDSAGVNQALVTLTDPTTPVDGIYSGDTYLDDGTGTFVKTGSVSVTVAGNEVTEVVYQPADDYNEYNPTDTGNPSLDQFVFTVADDGKTTLPNGILALPQPAAETIDATVFIQVRPQNDPPVATDDVIPSGTLAEVFEDTAYTITASTLLANDFAGQSSDDDESLGTNGNDGSLSLVTVTGTDPNFPLGFQTYPQTTTAGGVIDVDDSGDLVYTPPADYYGDDSFTYWMVDQGIDVATDGTPTANPKYASAIVSLTVSPVNDAPSTTAKSFTTDEDTSLNITAGQLYASSIGDASTTAVIPLDESNQTFRIIALDADGTSITAANAASGPFATPHGTIDSADFDANGHLIDFVYTPTLDFNSTDYPDALGNSILDTFDFTVEDDGLAVDPAGGADIQTTPLTVVATATIFVTSINDAPLLDTPADVTINEDDPLQTVALTGIAPGGGEPQDVRISAISSDTTLFLDPVVTYSNPDATGSLSFTPISDRYGTATVEVTIEDAGLDNDFATAGDNLSITKTFTVTIDPVNDAPSTTDKSFVTDEDTPITITAGNLFASSLGHANPLTTLLQQDETNQAFRIIALDVAGTSVTSANASSAPFATPHGTIDSVNFDGNGHLIDFVYSPTLDFNSTDYPDALGNPILDTFGFTVQDDGLAVNPAGGADFQTTPLTVDGVATIFITSINDDPLLDTPADVTIDEDDPLQTIGLTGIAPGGGEPQNVRISAVSSDATLFLDPIVTYSNPDTIGSLSFTPIADRYGTASIAITIEDAGLDQDFNTTADNQSVVKTFVMVINPINDKPSTTNKSFVIDEDTPLTVTAAELIAGSAGDANPLTSILQQDETNQAFRITALDADGTTITAANASSVPFATPHGQIVSVNFDGNGYLIDVLYTPSLDFNSTATLDASGNPLLDVFGFTVEDDGLAVEPTGGADIQTISQSVQGIVTIFVTSINDDPLLDTPADVTIFEDAPLQTITLTGIAPGGGEVHDVRLTATSSDTTLFVDPVVTYTSPNSTGTLTFTPIADRYGIATIEVTIEDAGLDNDFATAADNLSVTKTFTVTVDPVNDAPSTTDKSFTTDEDTSLTITAGDLFAGSVGDADPLTTLLQQDETNQAFRITALDVNGTSVTSANAASAPFASLHGTVNNVTFDANGHLVDFIYTPTLDFNSTDAPGSAATPIIDTFGFTVEDDGLAIDSAGGADIATTSLSIDGIATILVTSINDEPLLDILADMTLQEDDSIQTIALTGIAPGGGEPQDVRISATSSDTTLFADPGVTYANPDTTGELSFTPIADRYGSATIEVTIEDAGLDNDFGTVADNLSITNTFTVTIDPVNDTPSTTDKSFTTDEDTSLTITASELFAGSLGDANPRTSLLQQNETNQAFRIIALDADGTSITSANAATAPFATLHGSIDSVTFDANGHLVDFSYTPASDFNSTDFNNPSGNPMLDVFGFTVEDDGLAVDPAGGSDILTPSLSVDGVATIFVVAIGDDPLIDAIPDLTINEDDPLQTIALTGIAAGGMEAQSLRVTASTSDTTLFAEPLVNYFSPGATGSLSFTPIADRYGMATVTVTVEDAGLDNDFSTTSDNQSIMETFVVTINPVNDTPAISDQFLTVVEDTTKTISAADLTFGATGDASPATNLLQQDETNQAFRIVALDADGTSITSSNAAAAPFATPHGQIDNVVFDANGHLIDFDYTPNADFNSTDHPDSSGNSILDSLGFTLEDDGLAIDPSGGADISTSAIQVSATATLFVVSVNDQPTLDALGDVSLDEDSTLTVNLSGIGVGGSEPQQVRVAITTDNGVLFGSPALNYTSPDSTGSIDLTPVADRYGSATITVALEDSGLDNDFATTNDNLTTTQTFVVTVNPVNDVPATTNKSFTTSEETPMTLSAADLFAGSLGDADPLAPSPQDESNQAFRVIGIDTDGVTITASNSSSAPFATLHGQIDNLRFDSAGHLIDLVYTPGADFSSTNGSSIVLDSFGFTVEDDGFAVDTNIGPDIPTSPLTVTAVASVLVTSVNDAPTLGALPDLTINEDGPLELIAISGVTPGAGETQSVRVTATSSDVSLVPNPSVTYASGVLTGTLGFMPVADRYGTTTITVTVEDAGLDNDFATIGDNLAVTQTFAVTVSPVNDPPSTTDKLFLTDEDTSLTISAVQLVTGSLGHADLQSPLPFDESNQALQVIAIDAGGVSVTDSNASSAPFALTNGQITSVNFDANGHLIDLVYAPNADSNLTDVFGFTVQDDGVALDPDTGSSQSTTLESVNASVTLLVTPVNDEPIINDLNDLTINEDDGMHTVDVSGISAGGSESQAIRVTASSSNSGLIDHPIVVYTSSDPNGTLQFSAEPNQHGTTTISVTVTDGGLDNNLNTATDNVSVTKTFEITVNPVNDAPSMGSISDRTIDEDAGSQTISLSSIDEGANETQEMEITATSDNPSLIATPTISFNGTGTTALLSFVPTSDSFGSATITVTLTDGGDDDDLSTLGDNLSSTETFVVTVNSVDDAPTASPISDVRINEDAADVVVTVSGVTPGPGESQTVRMTATSNNTDLIANPTVVYASPDATGQLQFQPMPNRSGAAVISVVIEDAGADGDFSTTSDNLSVTESFIVLVDAVNDQPTLDALADQTVTEDSGSHSINLTGITAGVNEADPMRIIVSSNDPSPVSNFNVTYASPASTGQFSYTPLPNRFGTATVIVTVEDAGPDRDFATSSDNRTFSQSFELTVAPVADSPSFDTPSDQTLDEDSSPTTITITGITAGLGETDTLRVTATSSNPGLIPDPTITYTSPSDTAELVLAPVADGFGSATIVLTVEDGGPDGDLSTLDDNQVTTELFTVVVTNLPDSPQGVDDRFATDENSVLRLQVSDILANDIDPDLGFGSNEVLSLNLTQPD